MDQPLIRHEGPVPTPLEAAQMLLSEMETGILATVYVKSWKTVWLTTILMMIIRCYSDSCDARFQALKGGFETDQEIRIFEEVMPLLGFKVDYIRREFPD